jgi:hypothetical protein
MLFFNGLSVISGGTGAESAVRLSKYGSVLTIVGEKKWFDDGKERVFCI